MVVYPCPFCNSIPEVNPENPEKEGTAWGEVRCVNIDCPTYPFAVQDGESVADDRGSDAYKKIAIRRWNAIAEPIYRLREKE